MAAPAPADERCRALEEEVASLRREVAALKNQLKEEAGASSPSGGVSPRAASRESASFAPNAGTASGATTPGYPPGGAPAGAPAPAASAGGSVASAPAAAPREVTVPRPSVMRRSGNGAAANECNLACASGPVVATKAPNPLLARAMRGKTADWEIIRGMPKSMRCPDYDLRSFYVDCLNAFPELDLFFAGTNGIATTFSARQANNSAAAECEYQRTVGALFSVYWLLRLDIGGAQGFCYGVDEDWVTRKPHPPATGSSTFAKKTPEEKRAGFLADMDWSMFRDLVSRAGCALDANGSDERIVALLCLTAFHDIMKLPNLQPIVHPDHAPYNGYEAGVRINDHDLALAYVMEKYPYLLPSYDGLDQAQRSSVLFTQGKMGFNHGWFVQAEAPPGGMLSKFKSVLEAGAPQCDIDLYFLHWITDLAGAQATPLAGAEKLVCMFPQHVLTSFLWSMPYLSNLAHKQETRLVEEYLEGRWEALLPNEPLPEDFTAIAIMRLVLMAQADNPMLVVHAFRELPAADQLCLTTELSRSGCSDQSFRRNVVTGGPAFLLYYGPGFLQMNNQSVESLDRAMRCLCVVLRGARALWPVNAAQQSSTVIIQIGELKNHASLELTDDTAAGYRSVWVILLENKLEGVVTLCKARELNALYMEGSMFRVLDFAVDDTKCSKEETQKGLEPMETRDADFAVFNHAQRILVFTDMSTECDDESALLWLLAALNRRGGYAIVELVHTDTLARVQWMAYIFKDKFESGEWRLQDGGTAFLAGNVLVNLYLAYSPSREDQVIRDLQVKGPSTMRLGLKEVDGKKACVPISGSLVTKDVDEVPAVALASVVIAAALPDVPPSFFERFPSCKCIYVVGTPGGVNCPMPSWPNLLAAMHKLAPVIYLTPQLTRTVRFPRSYVAANKDWPATIKYTVWQACVTFMTRRPEPPPRVGNWGFVLRLNVANAIFCRDWYQDVLQKKAPEDDSEVSEEHDDVCNLTMRYVDRMSGDDRALGCVVQELKLIGKDLHLTPQQVTDEGHPLTDEAKEIIREAYRSALFKHVYICVLTSKLLLWMHPQNRKAGVDEGGFEKVQPRCGYVNPEEDLSQIYGEADAITFVQGLPLRWLTPAYDVVGMICADAALEEGSGIDGGLGLKLDTADSSMFGGILTDEQINASDHLVLQTLPQNGEGIYAVGPFS